MISEKCVRDGVKGDSELNSLIDSTEQRSREGFRSSHLWLADVFYDVIIMLLRLNPNNERTTKSHSFVLSYSLFLYGIFGSLLPSDRYSYFLMIHVTIWHLQFCVLFLFVLPLGALFLLSNDEIKHALSPYCCSPITNQCYMTWISTLLTCTCTPHVMKFKPLLLSYHILIACVRKFCLSCNTETDAVIASVNEAKWRKDWLWFTKPMFIGIRMCIWKGSSDRYDVINLHKISAEWGDDVCCQLATCR